MNSLASAILATLQYSDHFHFPLTLDEIHPRLIGVKATPSQLTLALARLLRLHRLEQSRAYYYLPTRRSLVSRRLQSARLSTPLLTRAHILSARLSSLSRNILAVYLTGSLAVKNTAGNSDIDLMIITQNNTLWTSRLLLTLSTTLLGLRRTPHSRHNSGKLCLNLYLTPTSFLLPPEKRSLYSAYELIQAVPLYDPHNTHAQLLAANSWIKKYLPNYPIPKLSLPSPENQKPGILESLLFHLQYLYMKPKITREYITKDAAFFHPHDPSPPLQIISIYSISPK